ncbi:MULTISPECIES: hypothetical protein [unclassified Streptomyces]|uniref:hypothetical protein n=1 Tax=unclassified Streptomyces TaxID=2593676 RepID=UPI0003A2DAE2|nr:MULTISPECIES: hypothetical protein [unclassified Streptomyces]
MALAFAGWFGGFGAFLLVAALGAIGCAVGVWLESGGGLDEVPVLFSRGRR